jgi:hypothetical protein
MPISFWWLLAAAEVWTIFLYWRVYEAYKRGYGAGVRETLKQYVDGALRSGAL